MSNAYAFDFLRTEHTLDAEGQPKEEDVPTAAATTVATQALLLNNDEEHLRIMAAKVAHKPDLEKQFDVIHFLQAHRSAGCLAPDVIYKATGIDLEETDQAVAQMLQRNPKIRVENVPDPENPSVQLATYAYQAKYNNVRDVKTLLAQINRCKNGVPMKDLEDAYEGVQADLQMLITAGDVLAIANSEDKDKILFPRGDAFLVELDGIVALKETAANSDKQVYIVHTDVDPCKQIRRGEAINVGGQWFRVSSAVKEGALSDQPVRAQAPLSVVSLLELSKRNEQDGYIRPFSKSLIPLDAPLKPSSISSLKSSKNARDKLHKLAHNTNGARSGMSTAAQLLSSNAHASNPTVLAQSFAMAATATNAATPGSHVRKRPTNNTHSKSMNGANDFDGNNTVDNKSKRRQAVEAQQAAASDPALSLYSHARRHGCTKDVRDMYLAMKNIPESDAELQALLVKHQLLEPGEQMRRPRLAKRANVDNDGKPKKRRYYERKNQRMTNTHLEGTEIGAVLRRAQELQQQGKSVGDGGM
ncbi:expressed unknown protein [Seminavis robusta]|uniref:TFA2 Winged helix domain-containing protein n=1 Tax=Seminavis robusta TaxID=568900 RepID=A0A9N8DWU5_9STRA|nr:expressed unknown protein [Seminavis robusta]|eukprot:Sro354_g124730.1 n/a (530) ;mRNA; f:23271-24860